MRPLTKYALFILALIVAAQYVGVPSISEKLIALDGTAVLVVHESGQPLGKEQQAVLTGTVWQQAVWDAAGQWRVFDRTSEFVSETDPWKSAIDKVTEVPWLVISSDKGSFSGPLPADNQAMLAKVKEYQ
jgi:hypothetical protein